MHSSTAAAVKASIYVYVLAAVSVKRESGHTKALMLCEGHSLMEVEAKGSSSH